MQANKKPFLRTAVALALAAAFNPVYAQEQEATDQQVEAEEKQAESEEMVEVVEVRGLRASLVQAQDLKKNSDSIIDAIVAEDIGKLPDNTVAESLARIAGVQVTRDGDEANGIIIRGVPDVTTTYNGREIFTAELRRVQLQDFPSAAIAGVEVYKSGTADIMEPGLGGLVNVRTRRPFDFEGSKVAAGFHYTYNDQNGANDPSGNILLSDRWKSDDYGEFGLLANVTYAQAQYNTGNRYNEAQPWNIWESPFGWWSVEKPGQPGEFYTGADADQQFITPTGVGLWNGVGKRYRPSANFSAQWRPNNDTELYLEGIYQGYRNEGGYESLNIDWRQQRTLTDVVVNDTFGAQSYTVDRAYAGMRKGVDKARTDTYQLAIGGKYNSDWYTLEADLAWTDSEYKNTSTNIGAKYVDENNDFPGELVVDFNRGDGAYFYYTEHDFTNADNYKFTDAQQSIWNPTGEGVQFRVDMTADTGISIFHTFQTGIRLNHRKATGQGGERFIDRWGDNYSFAQFGNDIGLSPLQLTEDTVRGLPGQLNQWLVFSTDTVLNNQDAIANWIYDYTGEEAWNTSTSNLAYNPDWYFGAEEDSFAIYGQTQYTYDIGDWMIDGTIGVRVVRTEATTTGNSRIQEEDGTIVREFRTIDTDYTDVLPNISVKAVLDDIQLRAGYTKTRTRVNFGDLNPAYQLTPAIYPDDHEFSPDEIQFDNYATSGNPDLKPLTADNFDISLEWYFSDTGYASAAAFYKKIENWTNSYFTVIEDPDYGTVGLTQPLNSGKGNIQGLEFNFSTFLNMDSIPEFFHPFGFNVNATYLKGEEQKPTTNPDGTPGEYTDYEPIRWLSDWTYNAAIFYERDGFGTRLSYNYRGDWTHGENIEYDFLYGTKARDNLSFSIWYDPTDYLTIYFDIANVLARPFNNYFTAPAGHAGQAHITQPNTWSQDVRDEGRYYGMGFRLNF